MLQLKCISKLGSLEFLKPVSILMSMIHPTLLLKEFVPVCILSPPDKNLCNFFIINDSFRHINDIAVSSVHF